MFKFLFILFFCSVSFGAIEYGNLTVKGTTGLENTVTVKNEKTLRMSELASNGSNYVAIKAPASFSADVTFTLPSLDGSNGQVLSTNGSGVLSFITPGNTLSTSTKTSNYTVLTSDDALFGDTTGGGFTITLYAASGNAGKQIRIGNTGTANSLTIDGNASETIGGISDKVLRAGEFIILLCDGTNWQVVSFRGREVVTVTSSVKTPAGNNQWQSLTGGSATLTRGTWLITTSAQFSNNGSGVGYSDIGIGLFSANGADSVVEPANFSSVSNITTLSVYGRNYTNWKVPSSDGATMPGPSHIVRVTASTSGSMFLSTYSAQTTSSNARVTAYFSAIKISD